jgi:hypothetical protein
LPTFIRHSRLGKAKNVENFKSEIQIVDTHKSLKTPVNIGFAASESQFNRTLLIAGINQLISRAKGEFKISELEQVCPGVSRDMVRHVLREKQEQGFIGCSGRGAGAVWAKTNGGNSGNGGN